LSNFFESRFIEMNNRGNVTEILATVDELYAPNFVFHDPNIPIPAGGVRSREDYKQFGTGFLAALPGQFTIEDLIAEGEKVVLRYTYRGTHQGQWRGVPPTGKSVTFTGTITYRIVAETCSLASFSGWMVPSTFKSLRFMPQTAAQ
jgi:SnoaL-like polyketide cyclase